MFSKFVNLDYIKSMDQLIKFLQARRSTKTKHMTGPGPTDEQLNAILEIAVRVPDHGKLSPFYFIIFKGDERKKFSHHLRNIWIKDHPDATQAQIEMEETRFLQAPVVIAVISRIRNASIPAWEQILSTGACCYNLCLAANAFGYGTNWLTQWYYNHPAIREILNLEDGRDNIAGFIFIGAETEKNPERERPELSEIINTWTSHNANDKKGDIYNKSGFDLPHHGFDITQSTTNK